MVNQPFSLESDEDSEGSSSVKTDTTVESAEHEWDVEKILAESIIDGVNKYLIKWEGFVLGESTWEPLENLGGAEDNEALQAWNVQKRRIRKGEAQPYDIRKFDDAKANFEEEKARRLAKREKKRRLRAAAAREPVNKKGIARKVKDTSARPSPTKSNQKQKAAREPFSKFPTRSVNDFQSSQYSLFNDPETTVAGADPPPETTSKALSLKRKRPSTTQRPNSSVSIGKDGASKDSPTKVRKRVNPVTTKEPTKNAASGKNISTSRNFEGSSKARLSKSASPATVPKATSSSAAAPKSMIAPALVSKTSGHSTATPKTTNSSALTPKAPISTTAAPTTTPISAITSKALDHYTIPKKRPVPDPIPGTAAKVAKIDFAQAVDVTTRRSSDTSSVTTSHVSAPSKIAQSKVTEKEAGQVVSQNESKAVEAAEASFVKITTTPADPTETASLRVSNTSASRVPDRSTSAHSDPAKLATETSSTATQRIPQAPPTRTSNVSAPLDPRVTKVFGTTNHDSIDPFNSASTSTSAATIPVRSAPRPAGSAPAPANIFNNWAEAPKARGRPRVNEYTPKDSVDPKFTNLSRQHRLQRYSVNEPQPNLANLTFVDPKTGKPSDSDSSARPSGVRLDTNIPRPDRGPANISTITPASEPRPAYPVDPRSQRRSEHLSARPPPHGDRKNMMCRFWLRDRRCKFDEHECKYAHHECDFVEPKRQQICKFWQDGFCQFADELCEYQHSYGPWEGGGFRISSRGGRSLHDRQSKSPERGGIRQDEAERRGRSQANTITHAHSPEVTMASPTLVSSNVHAPSLALSSSNATELSNPRVPRRSEAVDKPSVIESAYQQPPEDLSAEATKVILASEDHVPHVPDLSACLKIAPLNSPTLTLNIRLVFDKRASRTKLVSITGEEPSFETRNMCLARDFEQYWFQRGDTWTSGRVVGQDNIVAEYLNDYLLMNSTGVIVHHEEFMILIYPTNSPEWGFLPDRGNETVGLRFHVQSSTPDTLEPITLHTTVSAENVQDTSQFVTMCERHLDLKEEVFFAGNQGKKVEKCVYMLFPPDLSETKLVEAYFKEIGARVYHSSDTKLWTGFLREGKQPDSVIVFHPAVYEYWEIPNLHGILHERSDNVFQLGPDKSLRSRPDAATRFSCVRLFPTGQLILITDDVFRYHPGLALKLLDSFEAKARRAPQGGRNDRICARPGLLAWLGQLIDEDYEKGVLTQDSDRIKVFQAAVKLSGLEGNETEVALHAFKPATAVLYSPPRKEAPEYEGLWDSSEEDATDWLVEWFCGYCIMERENFRRFTVLYEQNRKPVQTPGTSEFKDPKDWMVKAQHVKVTNPVRFLERHKQKEQAKNRA